VTGRMQHGYAPVADLEDIGVRKRLVGEADLCSRSQVQGRSGRGGEFPSRRAVVGMDVGVDYMSDHHGVVLRGIDVGAWIALGIDDRAHAQRRTSHDV
jgi:hypothetical protein